jgi:Na+-transporting NADH:ubiquinone oxidoreductase subunit NqrA
LKIYSQTKCVKKHHKFFKKYVRIKINKNSTLKYIVSKFFKKYVRIKNNKNPTLKYIVSKTKNKKKKSMGQKRKAQDHAGLAHHFWA